MLESILPIILQYNMDDSMTVKIQNRMWIENSKQMVYMLFNLWELLGERSVVKT